MAMSFASDRRRFLQRSGALFVLFSLQGCGTTRPGADTGATLPLAPPKSVDKNALDAYLAIGRDGRVTAYTGKVDLGTGTRTALAQIVAEELDLRMDQVDMVMGDTATTVDQWLTAGSLTISYAGVELRKAAATARQALLAAASRRLGAPPEALVLHAARVALRTDPARGLGCGELLGDGSFDLPVDPKAPPKPPAEYQLVGRAVPRVDIPAKVSGEFLYIHDLRLPGMLHARVLRPDALGARLQSFDDSAARRLPGFVRTVRRGDFLAVLARDEWSAIRAMRALCVDWTAGTGLPPQDDIDRYWRQRPVAKLETTQQVGDAPAALAAGARRIAARYAFAVQTHAAIGPSCAVATLDQGRLVVWTASQASHSLQDELAALVHMPRAAIRVVYLDGAGCYGRNGHEDAAADAALIATMVGGPVRVQWMRDDETARSPKSPPRAMDLEASIDAQGRVLAWSGDFYIAQNHVAAFKPLDFPLLAATETGVPRPGVWVGFLQQNSAAPYRFPHMRVQTRHLADTPFRAAHLRSPGRIENSFANESFVDELAHAVGEDPANFRLRHLQDARGEQVVRTALRRAGWQHRAGPQPAREGDWLHGRGMAYVRYNNTITYVAAVAEVAVQRSTGAIRVERICIAHDCGQIINSDGVANQVEGGALQTVSRTLMEQVHWDDQRVTSVDWASYPILRAPDAPRIEVDLIDRPGEPPWGAGEATPTAIPAAIGNAVFDATGARLRAVPFTPERVLAALATVPR